MDELSADRFEVHHAAPRGHRQAYVDEGEGPPLLLVHGWPETMRIWWRNVQPLVDAGFRVVVPDLRGFGGSEMPEDGYGDVAAHSRDLHALVDHLGIDRVVAVAGDLGGAVIQDLAARFDGLVGRMVLFNAPLPFLPDRMEDLRTRPAPEATDYFVRQGTDADALAAELDTPRKRRRYVAAFYTSRFWAHPGGPGLRPDGRHRVPRPRRPVPAAGRRTLRPVGGRRRAQRCDRRVLPGSGLTFPGAPALRLPCTRRPEGEPCAVTS